MKQNDVQSPAGSSSPSTRKFDPLSLATLTGVVVMLTISLLNMRDLNRLGARVGELETQVQPAAEQGPDPNRVYTITMAGAPTKGPDTAPVTIAEFSDFQ